MEKIQEEILTVVSNHKIPSWTIAHILKEYKEEDVYEALTNMVADGILLYEDVTAEDIYAFYGAISEGLYWNPKLGEKNGTV